jgi:hypothetical protein
MSLLSHLDPAFPNGKHDWTYNKIKRITYIDDIINETL